MKSISIIYIAGHRSTCTSINKQKRSIIVCNLIQPYLTLDIKNVTIIQSSYFSFSCGNGGRGGGLRGATCGAKPDVLCLVKDGRPCGSLLPDKV